MVTIRSSFCARAVPWSETEPNAARTDRRPARAGRATVGTRANPETGLGMMRDCDMCICDVPPKGLDVSAEMTGSE
jgi:hypothetical protein